MYNTVESVHEVQGGKGREQRQCREPSGTSPEHLKADTWWNEKEVNLVCEGKALQGVKPSQVWFGILWICSEHNKKGSMQATIHKPREAWTLLQKQMEVDAEIHN